MANTLMIVVIVYCSCCYYHIILIVIIVRTTIFGSYLSCFLSTILVPNFSSSAESWFLLSVGVCAYPLAEQVGGLSISHQDIRI